MVVRRSPNPTATVSLGLSSPTILNMAWAPEHIEFRKLIEDFCEAVEHPKDNPLDSLTLVRNRLIPLYAAALILPEMPGAADETPPIEFEVGQHFQMLETVRTYTGSDLFWFCYEPFAETCDEPVATTLAGEITEVWYDVKPGLLNLADDEQRWAATVFWDWKFSFETHWGNHAVDSIWAIHKLLRDARPGTTHESPAKP